MSGRRRRRPVAGFGLSELLVNSELNPGVFGVLCFLYSCEATCVSGVCGKFRLRVVLCARICVRLVLLEQTVASAAACAPISDLESYPYRIGTVNTCRDAAYADAGVRSGALLLTTVGWPTSLGLH